MTGYNKSKEDVIWFIKKASTDIKFVRLMCPAAESGLTKFRNCFRNIHEVISAFKRFDENCDGSLSQQELVSGVGALGLNLSSAEVKAIFTLADVNQDGEVNYTEFVSALYPVAADGIAKIRKALKDIACVRQAFKKFDADGDGEISIQELKGGAKSIGKLSDEELMLSLLLEILTIMATSAFLNLLEL